MKRIMGRVCKMSEFSPSEHESDIAATEHAAEEHRPEQEQPAEQAPRPEETPTINIEDAREKALEQPETPLELPVDSSPEGDQPIYIDRAMKRISLNNELKLIRAKLSSGQRLLSRGVHQPTIRRVSDVAAHTITRPYGLLGGGILAFCGSLLYLLFSKYVGLKYNYLMFILLFILGYALATVFELLYKASHPPEKH